MFAFDEREVVKALDRVDRVRRVAFATACAAKLVSLLPRRDTDLSAATRTLNSAVGFLEADVREDGHTAVDWQEQLDRVMSLLPIETETGEEGMELLDDCAAAVAYAIRTKLTSSSQEAAWSARRCYEYFDYLATMDFANHGVDEPSEEQLLADPKIQGELKRQHELLDLLETSETSQGRSGC